MPRRPLILVTALLVGLTAVPAQLAGAGTTRPRPVAADAAPPLSGFLRADQVGYTAG